MNSGLAVLRQRAMLAASICVLFLNFASAVHAQNGDVSVLKSTLSNLVQADSDVTFEVVVSNTSLQDAPGPTVLTDAIPANMTFVSATFSGGWNCVTPAVGADTGVISCTFEGTLPAEETTFSFFFVFHVKPNVAAGTSIVNTVNVTNSSDLNESNNQSMASVTVQETPPAPPATLAPKDVLISEFRLAGPGGANDKYIELYCNRDVDCVLTNSNLRAWDPAAEGGEGGFFVTLFPSGLTIPARHFLLVGNNSGYSLNEYATLDLTGLPFLDNQGFQLLNQESAVVDSVGFIGGGNPETFIEGTGLQQASARPADQYAYVRKRTLVTSGLPQDTDNNANDFVLVSVTGTAHEGIGAPPVLGAPGPKGLNSPRSYRNSQVTGELLDPEKTPEADPNKIRVGSGNSGTLAIRRSFKNNTSNTFDYLGFRVIEISTLNSPVLQPGQAQLRLISSGPDSATVPSRGGPVSIDGTVLEYDSNIFSSEPQQAEGGLNSSVYTDAEQLLMGPGDTQHVQFVFNVLQSGYYRFFVYVEAGVGRNVQEELSSGRLRRDAPPPVNFDKVLRVPMVKAKQSQRAPVISTATRTATPAPVYAPVKSAPAPRVVILNLGTADGGKKPRRKTRLRKKSSAALKKKAEEKFAAEKPQN